MGGWWLYGLPTSPVPAMQPHLVLVEQEGDDNLPSALCDTVLSTLRQLVATIWTMNSSLVTVSKFAHKPLPRRSFWCPQKRPAVARGGASTPFPRRINTGANSMRRTTPNATPESHPDPKGSHARFIEDDCPPPSNNNRKSHVLNAQLQLEYSASCPKRQHDCYLGTYLPDSRSVQQKTPG